MLCIVSSYYWSSLKVRKIHLYHCFYTLRYYSKKLATEGILCSTENSFLVANEQGKQTCCIDSFHIFVTSSIPNPF
jgi:hypothetical protein